MKNPADHEVHGVVRIRCRCGGGLDATVAPAMAADRIGDAFWQVHRDPGCGPVPGIWDAPAPRKEKNP